MTQSLRIRATRIVVGIAIVMIGMLAMATLVGVGLYVYLKPGLPTVADLRDIRMQLPLRIFTRDGKLMATIGDQRRIPVSYDQVPPKLIQAFLATEDDRFFEHPGVDWRGIARATVDDVKAGGLREGASTITQQLSRDLFLSPKRDLKRKLSEMVISLMLETHFTKRKYSRSISMQFSWESAPTASKPQRKCISEKA